MGEVPLYAQVSVLARVPRSQESAPPQGPPQGPRHRLTVGSEGGALFYEGGAPASCTVRASDLSARKGAGRVGGWGVQRARIAAGQGPDYLLSRLW